MIDIYGTPAVIRPMKEGAFHYTALYYTDGHEQNAEWHIRTVMKQIAESRGIDLRLLRKRRKAMPLDLHEGYVLVPVKLAETLPMQGYADLLYVEAIEKAPDRTGAILYAAGRAFPVYEPFRNLAERYADACLTYGLFYGSENK